eukprot:8320952-Pyramimonas_sp.AAC.1
MSMSMAQGLLQRGVLSHAVVSRDRRASVGRSRVVVVQNLRRDRPGWVSKQTQESQALRGRVVLARASSMNLNEDSLFDEEMAVPKDQRPVNELKNLQVAPLYSW